MAQTDTERHVGLRFAILAENKKLVHSVVAHPQVVLVNLVRVLKSSDVKLLLLAEGQHLLCGRVENLARQLNMNEF